MGEIRKERIVKRIALIAGFAVLGLATSGYAQFTATIAGGPHDLSNGSAVRNTNATINGQTCVFCHVPHGGSTSMPLWNRSAPTGAAYQVYTSSTSAVVATAGAVAGGISGACLSCHDGTIAMDVVTNVNGLAFGTLPTGGNVTFTAGPNKKATYSNGTGGTANVMSGGLPFLGSDLRNDHPVAIVYQTAQSADPTHYATVTQVGAKIYVNGAAGQLPLFGASSATATVECASCHDAHNNSLNGTNGGFLRQANTGSQMCKACHNK
jgi:predicted CXXCH cytochrome family protein